MHRKLHGSVVLFALLLAWWPASAAAQASPAIPPRSLAEEFGSLAGRAGTIFVGQVLSVERRGGTAEVTFRVEQAVLGAVGARYALREWAGLWPQGQSRYTPGQRVLVFLHRTSSAGFGSPVNGAQGVVPVLVAGAHAPELLDIRRLDAALLRVPGTPLATEANGAIALSAALPLIAAGLPGAAGHPGLRPEPVRLPMPVHLGLGSRAGVPGRSVPGTPVTSSGLGLPGVQSKAEVHHASF